MTRSAITLSQCDRIKAMLRDGRWHSVAAIHARCGFSRLNSRISELRSRRGMNIECRHIEGRGRARSVRIPLPPDRRTVGCGVTVIQITHRSTTRRSERFSLPADDMWLLDLPEAQPVIARVGASVDPDDPNRMEHVMRVAAICVRAKRRPSNVYANATL